MGPKKKGKASKFARMTEEEKARYLQHRAAIEEEARRRKQELVFTFLKSKFKKEEAFARINLAKINQQWRQILRNVKIVEMKKELEALQQSFERIIVWKDHTIENLLQGIEEAEVQYRKILHSHICATDRLLALQDERLKTVHEIYLAQKDATLKERDRLLEEFTASNASEIEEMHLIIHAGETKFHKAEFEEKADFITRNNEMKNQLDNEQNHLKFKLETTMESLWKSYQDTVQEYFSSTEERRKQYSALKAKDDLNCAIIQKQSKRLEEGEKLTEKLKEHLSQLQKTHEKTINSLKDERQEYTAHFYKLKSQSLSLEKFDKEQLKHLTSVSGNVIQTLEKLTQKAENILRLAQSCHRYETLEEKVIRKENKISIDCQQEENIPEAVKINLSDYEGLEGFWNRFNKVLMECATLKLHSSALTIENEQLKAALKHYLSSISPSSQFIGSVSTMKNKPWNNSGLLYHLHYIFMEAGERRHSAMETIKGTGTKIGMIESSSKELVSRKDYHKNRPRPVTAIEGAIAIRNNLPS